ncbi:bifunctional alpha/beta hydrolase/OsmC family protein [Rubrivirga litoralis]|uniref:Bifunctional alpha/beta hydrolase/OsmC family protein n=1 Tax=Rubrivirga litoralis TaxID=3075598 RepID=A0ABU3BUM9_9BACT|nr:bifunctional alpha/beta hydrolase/OsmC family protein [Rubrivirga sp. F394]MDT0633003.1 bifunctional alpha/beta hydrolase/OsmC family protein [Rubrivirga sp. F394]
MPRSERLMIPREGGAALAARLDLPDSGEPSAYALFAHCFTCSKDLHAVRRIGSALAERGVGVLAVDFTGLGRSEGAFEDTSFSTTVQDLVDAAAFLEAERGEGPQLLVGHSLGGAAVLAAAERVPSSRAVATIAAPCDPAHVRRLFVDAEDEITTRGEARVDIGGRPFTVRREFLDDLESHDAMHDRIARLGRALLVFHSPQDRAVGVEQARHIFQAARHPKSFVSLDGADHLLSDAGDARYVADVLAAWAGRYLCPSPDATPPAASDAAKGGAAGDGSAYADPTVRVQIGKSGFRTQMSARGFGVAADEPRSVGGTESGPTPYDLLGMALGACTAMTVRMYADRKGLPLDAVEVDVAHAKVHATDCQACETGGARLDRLTRTLRFEGDLDDDARAKLAEIADKCPVHRTIEGGADVVTELAPPDASP